MRAPLGPCGRDTQQPATGVERFALKTQAYEFVGCPEHIAAFQRTIWEWIACATPVDRKQPGNCRRCLFPEPAKALVRLAYKADRYSIALCRRHADKFDLDMTSWARCSTVLEVPVDPQPAPVQVQQRIPVARSIEPAPADAAPALPVGHDEWTFTVHALQREALRGVTHAEVLWAVLDPEVVRPGRTSTTEIRIRGHVHVVVEPDARTILTVVNREQEQQYA